MPELLIKPSSQEEQQELEAVVAYLDRTPRLANLLRYLGQRYFNHELEQLTEYNIATEVFGRKKNDFVASEDAIARVETHRLRKKLKAFYEGEGRDHAIHLQIPHGTYIPEFTSHREIAFEPAEAAAPSASIASSLSEPRITPSTAPLPTNPPREPLGPISNTLPAPAPGRRTWQPLWIVAALIVLGVAVHFLPDGVAGFIKLPHRAQPSQISSAAGSGTPPTGTAAGVAIPFRMIAGYDGPPQRDSAGDLWQADRYSHEGWSMRRPAVFVARTSDPFLFRSGRAGDFSYDIPLRPGVYELHLYFFQASDADELEDAANKSVFNVTINGTVALESFDPISDAMGQNIADERVIRDVAPASDGFLHIHLSTVIGTPSLSAIELLPGEKNAQLPTRIIAQSTSFTDPGGLFWHPDSYFMGGRRLVHTIPVKRNADPNLINTERYGHFTYAIPVDPRDRFTVILHFAELYYGTEGDATGSRIFRVMCNGNTLLDHFDIYKEAGSLHMLEKSFRHIEPTAQGKLNITFEPIKDYATVSEIEVIDESH